MLDPRSGHGLIQPPSPITSYPRSVVLRHDMQMMIQAGIMIQDPRHTLPNLKTLLLTLASRDKAPVEVAEVRPRAGEAGVG